MLLCCVKMASDGDDFDDSPLNLDQPLQAVPPPKQLSSITMLSTASDPLDVLTTAIISNATTSTSKPKPNAKPRRPGRPPGSRSRRLSSTTTRRPAIHYNLYDQVTGRITSSGHLAASESVRTDLWGPDQRIYKKFTGDDIGTAEEFEAAYGWDEKLPDWEREQWEAKQVRARRSGGERGQSRGVSEGVGDEGKEEERRTEENAEEQERKRKREMLRLPDGDLLRAIHGYASDYYGAMPSRSQGEGQLPDEGGRYSFLSMEASALLAFGILLEEAGKEILGAEGDMVLVEPRGWERGLREDARTRWLLGGRVEPPVIPSLESSDEDEGEEEMGMELEEPTTGRKRRKRSRSRTEDR